MLPFRVPRPAVAGPTMQDRAPGSTVRSISKVTEIQWVTRYFGSLTLVILGQQAQGRLEAGIGPKIFLK
jgi:hypothetical protein